MSAYLVNRDGQELGSFELPQIKAGLQTGQFEGGDWGWRDGMADWQPLSTLVGNASPAQVNQVASPSKTVASKPAALNPYASPSSAQVRSIGSPIITSGIPQEIVAELAATKPWVRFISILGWIVCSILGLAMIIAIVQSFLSPFFRGAEAITTTLGGGIAMYLILYPTLKLTKYASHIKRLMESNSAEDLTNAMREQRHFWKFYGIASVLYVGFFLMLFLFAIFTRRPF